jgi:lipoprotein-anchoring transpeptidase ErfK/SrfK
VRAGWGLGLVALFAAGGLLAGIGLGSAPGARPAAVRALGGLPELLRPDLIGPTPASRTAAPVVPLPFPRPSALPHASATPAPAPTRALPTSTSPTSPSATSAPSTSTPTRPADPAAPPCAPTARACVDLSANRSWLLRDGRVAYGPVPITHGRKGFRTPPGTFQVAFKSRDHVSSIYDAEMPWAVFFNGGVAFHEGSLGVLSHGCIHLSPAAAETYFATLSVGDVVQVVP